jgi:MraZ protein
MESTVLGSKLKPLLGTDEATIDGKGRILVSKKKRDRLGESFAMCLGDNGCLYAYPGERWEQILEEIFASDPTNPGRQTYTRMVLGTADDELGFDDQGRVVVPQKLRTMAKLEKEVVLIGCGDRLEIWAKEEYNKFLEYGDSHYQERKQAIQKARQEMKLG